MPSIFDNPEDLLNERVPDRDYVLCEVLGKGKNGVVYKAQRRDPDDVVACKVIPLENLKGPWDMELEKAIKLQGIAEVVQYRQYSTGTIKGNLYACIMWELVVGENLRKFSDKHPTEITLPFISNLAYQVLRALFAMKKEGFSHGDLHEGNILIAKDPRVPEEEPRIRVTDFGIGSPSLGWEPTDDFQQLALVCRNLLERIDPSNLNQDDRKFYTFFVNDFLQKKLSEKDPTVGDFVRNPKGLIRILQLGKERATFVTPAPKLENPFDYLSCEQIGDSFELLQLLYTQNFIGYSELTRRSNTILTGPRGCGKTTIFRNMSLKTIALAGKLRPEELGKFVGVYYQANDLYYCFPYTKGKPSEEDQRVIVQYFDLAILFEILDTLSSIESIPKLALSRPTTVELEDFVRAFIPRYVSAPIGTNVLDHLKSVVSSEKIRIKQWIASDRKDPRPDFLFSLDFLKRLCGFLQEKVPWLKGRPFYFFIDDYSLPRISDAIQMSLGDFILDRYSECYFKISTDSIITIYPTDSHGKLLEETREYNVVDLGAQFIQSDIQVRRNFLREVVNQRLRNAAEKQEGREDIVTILGSPAFKNYDAMARTIRERKKKKVLYTGWTLVVDLCSGDIATILQLIQDIFTLCGSRSSSFKSAPSNLQDQAIRDNANEFLEKIGTIPDTGPMLRQIAEAFGSAAKMYLLNLDSGNVKGNPPWQAFRIEVREGLDLKGEALKHYKDIIRYSVFLRDARGKSQRGAVVPRLYLRRLLIPSFKLTPKQRDNVGLEVKDFVLLLTKPKDFVQRMKNKKHSVRADRKQMKLTP